MKTDKYAKLYDDTMNRKEALFADSHARFTAWLNKNESKLANYIDKLLSKAIDKGYSKVRIDFGTTEEWINNTSAARQDTAFPPKVPIQDTTPNSIHTTIWQTSPTIAKSQIWSRYSSRILAKPTSTTATTCL